MVFNVSFQIGYSQNFNNFNDAYNYCIENNGVRITWGDNNRWSRKCLLDRWLPQAEERIRRISKKYNDEVNSKKIFWVLQLIPPVGLSDDMNCRLRCITQVLTDEEVKAKFNGLRD
jgi:hypothetical protein